MASYTEEFKKKVVRLHLEEGRSIRSLAEEFNMSKKIPLTCSRRD